VGPVAGVFVSVAKPSASLAGFLVTGAGTKRIDTHGGAVAAGCLAGSAELIDEPCEKCSLEHYALHSSISRSGFALSVLERAQAIGAGSMADEAPLKSIRELLLRIRNAADAAMKRIDQPADGSSLRWVCTGCRYVKTFVKPVELDSVGKCPRCRSSEFRVL
jgi:hypothetical protein